MFKANIFGVMLRVCTYFVRTLTKLTSCQYFTNPNYFNKYKKIDDKP